MVAIGENTVLDPVKELAEWYELKRRIAEVATPLIASERLLRQRLFNHFFPTPKEGTNTFVLPDGYQVKGVYPIERKVDPAVVDTLRTLRLMDLPPELVDSLHIDRSKHAPEEPVVSALSLSLDSLLAYKPEVVTKTYRTLTAEQQSIFDRCLTIKPGSIGIEVTAPAKPKGSAGTQPAGFGPQAPTES